MREDSTDQGVPSTAVLLSSCPRYSSTPAAGVTVTSKRPELPKLTGSGRDTVAVSWADPPAARLSVRTCWPTSTPKEPVPLRMRTVSVHPPGHSEYPALVSVYVTTTASPGAYSASGDVTADTAASEGRPSQAVSPPQITGNTSPDWAVPDASTVPVSVHSMDPEPNRRRPTHDVVRQADTWPLDTGRASSTSPEKPITWTGPPPVTVAVKQAP